MPQPACYIAPTTVYYPAVRGINLIVSVPNGIARVTTTSAHGYKSGLIVRFSVPTMPAWFGMPQINGLSAPIIVTSDASFVCAIDVSQFQPWVFDPAIPENFRGNICPQVIPFGEVNDAFPGPNDGALLSATVNILGPVI